MLSETARQRVQQLAKMGVGVVLLDECHHLASLWGYVIRADPATSCRRTRT